MQSIRILLLCILLTPSIACAGKVKLLASIRNFTGEALTCSIVSSDITIGLRKMALPIHEGHLSSEFNIAEGDLLSFSDGTNYFAGFAEPGDSIVIQYDFSDFGRTITFSGRGREKFEIPYAIHQIRSLAKRYAASAKNTAYPVDVLFNKLDSLQTNVLKQIGHAADQMSQESNLQLRAYLHANALHARMTGLVVIFGDSYELILKNYPQKLSHKSVADIRKLLEFDERFHGSRLYVDAVEDIMSIYLEENVQQHMADFSEQKYQYLLDRLPPKLRTPVLFTMLDGEIKLNKGVTSDTVFLNAAKLLDDDHLEQIIVNKLAESGTIQVGAKAPAFTLQNLAGQKVDLASFAGKTVYMDFWFAACGPCHMLFKAIEPVKKHFEADDRVVFLVISVDDEKTWKKAIAKFSVKGYHVFTENRFRDHPVIQSYQVGQYPTTYVINPKGEFHSVNPAGNPEILIQQITESLPSSGERR